MLTLDDAHRALRIIHAAVGFAGLVLFWLPVIARKGSRLHIVSGRLFAWCGAFVGITGLFASLWGLAHPASFLGPAPTVPLTPEQAGLVFENLRFVLSITGFLALGVLSALLIGTRLMAPLLRPAQPPARLDTPLLRSLLIAFLLWSAALALYGSLSLLAACANWHPLPVPAMRYLIPAVLGGLGVYGALGDLAFVRAPDPDPRARRAMHMQCMVGAGAGFYAAFFLFGASRLVSFPGAVQLLAPLLPLAVAAIAVPHWSRRRQRLRSAPDSA